ncbi:hypothetical protein ANCCAN_19442 [Ancylostoma caninum]|uniref:Uncharacterized protein n=1 Tax=Ancylostoma caninum TaxID=29170 RepID=A0A368FWP4_ANCCA|nr:hypothetical protein ANCCAN_19442 [Ancylostoma caninum]
MTCKHLDGNGENFDLGLPAVVVPVLALVLATSFHSLVTRHKGLIRHHGSHNWPSCLEETLDVSWLSMVV